MKVKLLKKLRKKARERIFIVEYCDALKERTGYDYVVHYPTPYGTGSSPELGIDSAYFMCKIRRRNFILGEIDSQRRVRMREREKLRQKRKSRERRESESEHQRLLRESKRLDY